MHDQLIIIMYKNIVYGQMQEMWLKLILRHTPKRFILL